MTSLQDPCKKEEPANPAPNCLSDAQSYHYEVYQQPQQQMQQGYNQWRLKLNSSQQEHFKKVWEHQYRMAGVQDNEGVAKTVLRG